MEGYSVNLEAWSACLRVLSDSTRVRLLALLEREELTVAELAAVVCIYFGVKIRVPAT